MIWPHLEQVISDKTQSLFHIKQRETLSGGDINNAYKISDGTKTYFVKTNRKVKAFMFEAELVSLNALRASQAITVPEPLMCGTFGSDSYLILQYIDMQGHSNSALFGEKLAQLHLTQEKRFGFDIDNSIGTTPQINAWTESWVEFWQKNRLLPQLELAKQNGLGHKLYDTGLKLIEKTPYFFQAYQPKSSLLHGDLWSGNWSSSKQGDPVIYDPATYFGDHETDLAMTELFGHPGVNFYAAYKNVLAIDEGFAVRKLFYNVYHILNHANLFSGSYVAQALNSMEQLLVE